MKSQSYVTFDVSPHQRVLRRGNILLDEIDKSLSFWVIPGIHPTYKFVKKRVLEARGLSATYLKELESVTGEESYRTEFDAPEGGEYVGYSGIIAIEDDVKSMRKIFRRLHRLAERGNRTTMRYTVLAVRSYARNAKKALASQRRGK